MRSLLPRRPITFDVGIAAIAAIFVTFGTIGSSAGPEVTRELDALAITCAVLTAGSLAWRRAEPLFALGCATVVVSTYLALGYPFGPIVLCLLVAMFEIARQSAWTRSLPACTVAVALVAVANLFREFHSPDTPALMLFLWGSWVIIPWSLGTLAHVRASAAERSRKDLAARAKLEERMRVAREVHDIAGHGFAVVAMQAGVALLVFDEQPDQARRSLESIQTTSTKALTELRTMLDAFYKQADSDRTGGGTAPDTPVAAETESPPRERALDELEDLIETVRAGGLTVELDIERMETPVPDTVGSTTYRVVQESLTNVLRHAGPTTAVVRVYREGTELVTEVEDSGTGTAATTITEGRGLIGMRGRVEAVGGRMTAGPREGGGFRVVAHLPIPRSGA